MARSKVRRGADGQPLQKYRVTYRCKLCAVKFKADVYDGDPDPACPNLDCGAVQTPIGLDVSQGRAPAVGGSLLARATDTAAEIVMEDHGLTNLSDATREGDTMAPKLTHAQQKVADGMFSPAARKNVFGGGPANPTASALNRIARQGMSAATQLVQPSNDYRDPVAMLHRQKTRVPTHIVTGDAGSR